MSIPSIRYHGNKFATFSGSTKENVVGLAFENVQENIQKFVKLCDICFHINMRAHVGVTPE